MLSFLAVFVIIPGCSAQRQLVQQPLIWNVEELNVMKRDAANSKIVRSVRKLGDKYKEEGQVVVTAKRKTFAPNKHYYCSIGPYWWPDPDNSGKYINRDGQVNPEQSQYDRKKLSLLAKRCQELGRAFYLSEDTTYYNAFIGQLRAWFIDENTYMYPNFEYAQVIPGQRNNQGRSTGLIDAYDFNTVIESIRLVNRVKQIDKPTVEALQQWFGDFANWAERIHGRTMRKSLQNISLAYDVTMANMYQFSGDEKRAKEIVDAFSAIRLDKQIMDDGSQPAELKRTKAFSYSMFNLMHIIDMCYLARYWYPNYYQEHRELIDKAFDFLGQYVDEPERFPYQQITSWDGCKKSYFTQLKRLEQLRGEYN